MSRPQKYKQNRINKLACISTLAKFELSWDTDSGESPFYSYKMMTEHEQKYEDWICVNLNPLPQKGMLVGYYGLGAVGALRVGWYHLKTEFTDEACLVPFFYPVTYVCLRGGEINTFSGRSMRLG